MSDDLVKRLRWAADNSNLCGEWNCNPDDLDSAADEITRLRAEVERLRKAMRLVEQRAENEGFGSGHTICYTCLDNYHAARTTLGDDKGVA